MKNLILNPGSTSTKIAVYDGLTKVFSKKFMHRQGELEKFPGVMDQKQYRSQAVIDTCKEQGIPLEEITMVIAIGGFMRMVTGGVYEVNDIMIQDLMACTYGEHASNLGGVIAAEIAARLKIKAYVADPISTDEMQEVARLSGLPDIVRTGRVHTLNQKAVAKQAAKELGMTLESANFVVAHLGGGISIGAHRGGLIVDSNDPRGEGPFCMDRPGSVHGFELAKLCYSGKYTEKEMLERLSDGGGVVAYMKTRDFFDVMRLYNAKDPMAIAVYNALVYQIAKEIGAEVAVLRGKVDAIIFTGGMAREACFIDDIKGYVGNFAKIIVYPGELEEEAMASYAAGVANGEIKPRVY
jgi:butyrate kinase